MNIAKWKYLPDDTYLCVILLVSFVRQIGKLQDRGIPPSKARQLPAANPKTWVDTSTALI